MTARIRFKIGAVAALLTAVAQVSAGPEVSANPNGASSGRRVVGINRDEPQVVDVNIQGGRNLEHPELSSAWDFFNWRVTSINSSHTNTLQTRMMARGGSLHGVALQEVCATNYSNAIYVLTSLGYASGTFGYRYDFVKTIEDSDLNDDCGNYFGNAVFQRGAFAAVSKGAYSQQDSEARKWMCARTYFVLCTTHITKSGKQVSQIDAND